MAATVAAQAGRNEIHNADMEKVGGAPDITRDSDIGMLFIKGLPAMASLGLLQRVEHVSVPLPMRCLVCRPALPCHRRWSLSGWGPSALPTVRPHAAASQVSSLHCSALLLQADMHCHGACCNACAGCAGQILRRPAPACLPAAAMEAATALTCTLLPAIEPVTLVSTPTLLLLLPLPHALCT